MACNVLFIFDRPIIYKGNKYLDQFDWTTAANDFSPFKTSIFGSFVVDWTYEIIKWHYTVLFNPWFSVQCFVDHLFVFLYLFLSAIVVSVLIRFMASSGYLFSILKLVWHFHLFSTHLQHWNWSLYVPI